MTTVFNLNRYDKIVANDLSLNGTISTALGGLSQWEDSGSNIYFSGGNVGIGTTSPDQLLHVKGTNSDYPAVRLSNDSANFDIMMTGSSFNDALFTNRANGNILFETTGNVGIGSTSPSNKLTLKVTTNYDGFVLINQSDNNIGKMARDANGGGYFNLYDTNGSGKVTINSSGNTNFNGGNVGIGTISPTYKLDLYNGSMRIYSTTTGAGPYIRLDNASADPWDLYINGANSSSTHDRAFYFVYNGGLKGRISRHHNGLMNIDNTFTGQHICNVDNIKYADLDNYIGLIVSANKNDFVSVNKNEIQRGIEGISITESVPIVSLTQKTKDKSCFGVIAYKENENNRETASGVFVTSIEKQLGDNRIHINSLGEGAIWVSNKNGTLESGDYITTSDIPGYGEKQDDDLLHNYTVAKITMDCNFLLEKQNRMVIKREDVQFYTDASNNTYDLSNNLIHYGANNPNLNKQSENTIQYFNKTFDNSGNILSVTRNVLNENGEIQWEQTHEEEQKYHYRYINASGSILTKDQYDTIMSGGQKAYIAAFVGCTYHCG